MSWAGLKKCLLNSKMYAEKQKPITDSISWWIDKIWLFHFISTKKIKEKKEGKKPKAKQSFLF